MAIASLEVVSTEGCAVSGARLVLAFVVTALVASSAHAGEPAFTVTSTADSGAGSLREAIALANGHAGPDTVVFAIPAELCSAAGVCRIDLATGLEILDPVILDGTTQPRYGTAPANVCATESAPSYMRVEIVGPEVDYIGTLRIGQSGNPGISTIRGLSLGGGAALAVLLPGAHRIQCNHLGVDGPGTNVLPLSSVTVNIEGNSIDTILGTDGDGIDDLGERNVFAGTDMALYVNANHQLRIAGNFFGLAANGTSPLPCTIGVYMRQSSGQNRIGTDFDGVSDELERNVFGSCSIAVWANTGDGLGPGDANVIAGNWIGYDAAGGAAPSGESGILVKSFGADAQVRYNRIANNPVGIRVEDYSPEHLGAALAPGSEGNCLDGNAVGLEHAGTATVAFERNWWGASDGPSGLLMGSGDPLQVTGTGSVDVTPWLTDGCPAPEPAAGLGALAALATLALRMRARR